MSTRGEQRSMPQWPYVAELGKAVGGFGAFIAAHLAMVRRMEALEARVRELERSPVVSSTPAQGDGEPNAPRGVEQTEPFWCHEQSHDRARCEAQCAECAEDGVPASDPDRFIGGAAGEAAYGVAPAHSVDDLMEMARQHSALANYSTAGVAVDAPSKWGKDGLCKGCGYEYHCRKNNRCERSFEPLSAAGVDACRVDQFSSRCCERGTKGCTVAHGVQEVPRG